MPHLLVLYRTCTAADRGKRTYVGPSLPAFRDGDERFLSDDCLRMPEGWLPAPTGPATPTPLKVAGGGHAAKIGPSTAGNKAAG